MTPFERTILEKFDKFCSNGFGGTYTSYPVDELKKFILEALREQKVEMLDFIAKKEGWEESRDFYAKHFGLETKYQPEVKKRKETSRKVQGL